MPTNTEPQEPQEPQPEDTGGRIIERTERVVDRPAPEKTEDQPPS